MFTDRPPDLNTEEFIRVCAGYAVTDGYAVQLTRPDHAAKRSGMVRTTAALVPFELLGDVCIGRVFDRLDESSGVEELRLDDLKRDGGLLDRPGAGALVDALVADGKLVWTGDGFEEALQPSWARLSPGDRRRLTFGAAVHPDAVSVPYSKHGLVVIRTAERYAQRWSWPQIDAASSGPSTSAGRAFLDVDDPAHQLAADILGRTPRLDEWRYLTEVRDRLAQLDDGEHEDLRALAQLVCLLAPDPAEAQHIKHRVALRLREDTISVSFANVQGLRTVDWRCLSGGHPVDELLRDWSVAVWGDLSRGADFEAAVAATQAGADEFFQALASQLRAAARLAPKRMSQHAAAALTQEHGMTVLRWLLNIFDRRELDAALADALSESPPPWLASFARDRRLPDTHAASVDMRDPVEAWRELLALSPSDAAMARLAARDPGPGTVAAARVLGDERLIRLAGALVAAAPRLLSADAPLDVTLRSIWAAAIEAGGDPWAAVDPNVARDVLFGELAEGQTVDQVLLRAVADSQSANLFALPGRADLWARIPPDLRQSFLSATAPTAAVEIAAGGEIPEGELQASVLSAGILGALARKDVRRAVAVLERLGRANAEDALVVMRAGRFDEATANQFGMLTVRRGWKRVARALIDAEATRPDLRVAADCAQDLLGFRERIKRAIGLGESVRAVATETELRAALLETATELYPRGPSQRSLWERAGGSESDLPDGHTGRERWQVALAAAAAGARGAPGQHDFLTKMLEDHPHNAELAALERELGRRT